MSKRRIIPVFLVLFLPLIVFLGSGCGKNSSRELYHPFPGKSWERFNLLSFEIPIEKANVYDIYLFARFANSYPYEALDFNMVMNTPAGEERINEYRIEVKNKSGNFGIECSKDSCMGTILLKREINIARPGVLKIEIENLTPRILTEGVLGVGIRWMPSGK